MEFTNGAPWKRYRPRGCVGRALGSPIGRGWLRCLALGSPRDTLATYAAVRSIELGRLLALATCLTTGPIWSLFATARRPLGSLGTLRRGGAYDVEVVDYHRG
jgi:hypothetical protein